MNDALVRQILQCPTLPSLPKVAIDVLALAEDPNVGLPAMAQLISQDAALVARTLKTVNSAAYGLSHKISSIDHALVVLGIQGVKSVVLGLSLVANLKKNRASGAFDHVAYWRRSLYAAGAARIFAQKFNVPPDEAFLAALLMDVGMLALDQVLGKEYAELSDRAAGHAGLAALEMGKFGMTHADVAGVLAGLWKLPPVLALPMKHHHRPQSIDPGLSRDVAEIVWLAGRCAAVFVDAQPEWSLCDVRRTCMDRYKIDELACDAMLCDVGKRTHELAPMFEVSMDSAAGGYEGVLRRANDALKNMNSALTEEGRPDDKRRSPRFARSGSLPIFLYVGGRVGETLRAEFRDASAQGVGLTVPRSLPVGTQFIIRLPRKQGEPLPILYTVVRAGKAGPEGTAFVGASLTSVLRAEDFGQMSTPPPAAKPAAVKMPTPVAAPAGEDRESGEERIRRAILESA